MIDVSLFNSQLTTHKHPVTHLLNTSLQPAAAAQRCDTSAAEPINSGTSSHENTFQGGVSKTGGGQQEGGCFELKAHTQTTYTPEVADRQETQDYAGGRQASREVGVEVGGLLGGALNSAERATNE